MSKYFIDKIELDQWAISCKDKPMKDFFRFVGLAQPHKLYKLYSSGDNIITQIENENIIIGKGFLAKPNSAKHEATKLLSLNCGNFDSGLHLLRDASRYEELQSKLFGYIESNNFSNLHLQDLSDDMGNFDHLMEQGYSGFWIPNLIYSEGNIQNLNSGLGVFAKRDFKSTMSKMYVSLHQGNLPKITHYTKNVVDRDLITVNCSIYQAFINHHQKNIEILSNTYISPFSRASDRLENILQTVKNLKEIKSSLLEEYPDYAIIERLTGDMNLYGVNSLYGPFGLKASPWSFGLPLICSLITGRNWPNELEIHRLHAELDKLGYSFVPANNKANQTIFINVKDHAPNFLKSLFKDKKVGWQLDLCIVPKPTNIQIRIDKEPFGDFDHSGLVIDI